MNPTLPNRFSSLARWTFCTLAASLLVCPEALAMPARQAASPDGLGSQHIVFLALFALIAGHQLVQAAQDGSE
ncbi:MAG: hypothetical protein MJD61_01290 [Proteobacteria bacterium]|nr:hypothetical protein [Pseudomonadota bacterium]